MEAQLVQLAAMDIAGLRRCWRNSGRGGFPGHLPRHLLISLVAFQMQQNRAGGSDKAQERYLDMLARTGKQAPVLPDRLVTHPHAQGTVFVRQYGETVHKVTATADGYEWEGKAFRSLSAAARAITGTRWNGPKFFGVQRERRGHAGS
jgi:hypothetical protein